MDGDAHNPKSVSLLVVSLMVTSSFLGLVAVTPVASAAVTTGATTDLVNVVTPYIRDDSSAIPIWGLGATSSIAGTDRLTLVEVVFDTTGTGLNDNEIKNLNNNGATSGVAIFRDDSNVGANDDVLDAADTPLELNNINWQGFAGDEMCRMWPNNEEVPTAAALQGIYQWFVVVRTDTDIDGSDTLRTYINAGGIDFSDGTSQPAINIAGTSLDVRETNWYDVGTGSIGRNLAQAALALTIVDGGPYEYLDYVTIQFVDSGGFQMTDLATIGTNPATSGIAIYRDDGTTDDAWDPSDTGLTPSATSTGLLTVNLDLNAEPIPDNPSGNYEYFVVIRTSNLIANNDQFWIYGDINTVRVDGTPNAAGDQDLWTPEPWNDDWEFYTADTVSPTITSYYWSESSSYLHVVGGTLWFSSEMTWSQSATFYCNAVDNVGGSGLNYADFSYEPSLASGGGRDTAPWYVYSYSIDAADSDTDSPAQVTVYDMAGNTATATLRYAEDNAGPSVSITAPPDLDTLSGTVSVMATAADAGAGVNTGDAWVSWDYGWTWQMMTWTGTHFLYNWDTTVLTDGNYRLLVRVRDMVYNAGTDFINVYVDNTGPAAAFKEPTNGQYVHSAQNLEVRATASDPSGVTSLQARMDGGAWTPLAFNASSGMWEGNVGVPGAGTHTLSARGVDGEGNVGTPVTITVIGDANDPTVSIVHPPAGAELSGDLTIAVNAADAERLAGVLVQLTYGATVLNFPATFSWVTGHWEVDLDTTTMPSGSYGVVAIAFDEAGRWAVAGPNAILIDNDAPALAVVSPVPGQYLYGDPAVSVRANDGAGSGFDNGWVLYSVDGGTPVAMNRQSGTLWTADLDTTQLADGAHAITFYAIDDAGNMAARTVGFVVDNTRPVVMVVAPATGEYAEGTFTFAVSAVDNMGIKNASVTIAGPSSSVDVALGYNAASGYYEWTADTTTWADGTYTIRAYATELSGRLFTGAASVGFYVDNNAPAVVVVAPADGETILTTSFDIAITASDGPFALAADKVVYRIDAGPWTSMAAGTGTDWTATWDTGAVADGEHVVHFRVTDAAGHVTEAAVTVTVDNTDPAAMVVVPSNGQFLEGTVTFAVMASDGLGVAGVDLVFTGITGLGNVAATYNPSTGYWEHVLDTTTLADGSGTLSAVATDNSGRTAQAASVDFQIDNSAPTMTVNLPVDGEVVTDGIFNIDVSASDPGFTLSGDAVVYSLDGGAWQGMSSGGVVGEWGIAVDVSAAFDGTHVLAVRATDAAGRVTLVELAVVVDNHDPVCQVVSPTGGEFLEGVYVFRVHAADALGVAAVDLDFVDLPGLDSASATWNPSTGYWEYPVDTTALGDSDATMTATATDASGRGTTTVAVAFTVDNHAPTLRFADPMDGDVITEGGLMVALEGDDEGFGLADGQVQLRVDGGPWLDVPTDGNGTFEWDWDTGAETDGAHVLTARARDASGHEVSLEVVVTVDNNDPSLKVVTPTAGQHLGGVVVFQVAAADSQGIGPVTLSWVEGGSVPATLSAISNYYEYTLDTSTLADGTYTLSVMARDGSGRSSTATAGFHVDNTPPALNLVGPLPGDVLQGDADITVTATDTFLASVQYRVDDLGWVDIEGDTGVLDTTQLSDGAHVITVRAMDEYGREVTTSADVVVDNNDPEASFASIPAEGSHVAGDVPIAVHADDAVGVTGVTVSIDGNPAMPMFLSPETGFYAWTFRTAEGYSDGSHTLVFTATDAADHETRLERSLFADNTGPVMTSYKPRSGAVEGMVLFKVTATDDSDVEEVSVQLGQGPWRTMTQQSGGSWVWVWDTDVGDNMEDLRVQFRAVDSLGNAHEESVTIDVDNTNWWPAVALAIIIILVVFLFLLWRKGYIGGRRVDDIVEYGDDDVEVDMDTLLRDNEATALQDKVEEAEVDLGIDRVG